MDDEKPALPVQPWPKVNELISSDGESIKADVQFVLDFAIIGRKCPVPNHIAQLNSAIAKQIPSARQPFK